MRVFTLIGLLHVLVFNLSAFSAETVQFDRDVAPLLKRHCVKCHGPVTQEGKLNLAKGSGLIRGGVSGTAVVPHDADASLLWQKVSSDEMPPDSPLSAEDKSLLKRWIVEGTSGLKRDESGDTPHWAFIPLSEVVAKTRPQFQGSEQITASSSVDRLLLDDLAQDGLTFLPEADRSTLIRRVSFDLTGLPPTPAEINEYLNDSRIDAYGALVERLLASPHFGERIGKVWLDTAGYADSNGYFNADSDRPLAFRYRDYVIRSFNSDKPYKDFLREQLAGDEISIVSANVGETIVLPDSVLDGVDQAIRTIELWDATHSLRNGQDGSGESDGNPDEVRIDRYTVLETAMQNISTGVLGLTIQCAKCHDHKFEPLTQRDYYAFQSILIGAFPPEQWKKPNERFVCATLPGEKDAWEKQLAESESRVSQLQAEVKTWTLANHPRGIVLFNDSFEDPPESLGRSWSNTAPGDDKPGGTAAVNINSREAPGAIIQDGHLQLIEGGAGGDKWLSTKQAIDWTPDVMGASVQVTFDLIDHHVDQSAPAERIGYFLALHDFHNDSPVQGGNLLIDGHPGQGSSVVLDYPGASSRPLGTIGKTGYVPGRNYGIRITNIGKGKFHLQHLVDWQAEEPVIKLTEADLPDGGFGFEFCCGRSFIVDNVVIEAFQPQEGADPLGQFLNELATRRKPLEEAMKTTATLKNSPPGKIAWTTDIVETPPEVHVLERGNYHAPAALVEPAGFAVLGERSGGSLLKPEKTFGQTQIKSSGRRRAFAEWLTQPDSQAASLIARVQVNRIWQHLFGTGLVATADNFGLSGAPPINRKLLDWLASEFVRSGWSHKHLLTLIVNSDAYRQSSHSLASPVQPSDSQSIRPADRSWQLDADGRRLSRYPVRRLDAEAIRDMFLSASGDLDDRLYGSYVSTVRTGNGETIVPEGNPGGTRRSIYLQQKRNQVHSLLQVFDAPSIVFNSTRRARSTMPLQSLSLLNSEFVVTRSKHLAETLQRVSESESDRIEQAYFRTVGRPPEAVERQAALQFLNEQRREYADQVDASERAWADLSQMLLVENAALYLE